MLSLQLFVSWFGAHFLQVAVVALQRVDLLPVLVTFIASSAFSIRIDWCNFYFLFAYV